MMSKAKNTVMNSRFRGYMPVVVDVETAGFDHERDALLEAAVIILRFNSEGQLEIAESYHEHITPFPGANLDPEALKFTGIKPFNPFRLARSEKEALTTLFTPIHDELKVQSCQRAVLVGHNPAFDLNFMNAAIERNRINNNPFHKFTTFDTATLSALAYGQTVLLKAAQAAGIEFDKSLAHSALYDAEKTAELFCTIVNKFPILQESE